jgi:putative ABC transport system ATP-binding protein
MFQNLFRRLRPAPAAPNGRYQHGNDQLIELRSVVKIYQSAAGAFTALKGVNLNVDRGEFLAIVGKSGSGKSTLINMITGIDRPTSGEVLVGDAAVHTFSEGQMAEWRGRNLGIIFQFFQLLPSLSLVENVMLPMDFCNVYAPRERHERAIDLLAQVEMAEQAHKLPSAVSGGQQQRVAIARALANDPPILVADEPTGNLDSRTAGAVFELFESLVAQGKTIVMVTHDQDLAQRASRAVIVADGQIVEEMKNEEWSMKNKKPDFSLLRSSFSIPEVSHA